MSLFHSPKKFFEILVRNFSFGVEDSLVSTVGMLSGVAFAGVPRNTILVTGFVLILVEAFSMGSGSFLAERSKEEYVDKRDLPFKYPFFGSLVMFFSYLLAGFIPLFPYIVFSVSLAFKISILFSLLALFLLGFIGAQRFKSNPLRAGLRMLLIGGLAVILGIIVGRIFKI